MEHRATSEFWRTYDALPAEIRSRADRQFVRLKTHPQHPSLHFKKLCDRPHGELWSVRVTLNHRALAIRRPDGYLWFWIGNHIAYDALIG